jgi:radical SAM protein, BA_1875 family
MMDYSSRPMIVYWELTQACGLACRHCRADAMTLPDPRELSTTQGKRILAQIAAFGDPRPHVIFTGGDPLRRADLYELMDEAGYLGLKVSVTPAATSKLTHDVIRKMKKHGLQSLGLSLDGSSAERHEAVRGVKGCFEITLDAARTASELGVPVQINTLVSAETEDDLPAIYGLLKSLDVMRWSLFFLIGVGRGRVLTPVSPANGEAIMTWVHHLSEVAPFAIKTTEAPSYRRIALQLMRLAGRSAEEIKRTPVAHGFNIRDGNGVVFVSSTGEIYPSGFLPLSGGNVRTDSLGNVYRSSPLFKSLHNPGEFKGKCGRCEYRRICGGSRARAYAQTGDPLESDPFCSYEPGTLAPA